MFGQVGAHNLSPSSLTDNMFPNSIRVNGKKGLEKPQCRKLAQCIWEGARRIMATSKEGNMSQRLSVFYPTFNETRREKKFNGS